MKKTILVTGASGFVGTAFLKRYANAFNIKPVCLIQTKVEELDFTGVDAVLHLAALVHQMKPVPNSEYFRINTELTQKVAERARQCGVKHFVFYSTVKVFGVDGLLWDHKTVFTPESECHPSDAYGQSKLAAEAILQKLNTPDFQVAVVRPPLIYGEGVKGNLEALMKLINLSPVLPLGYFRNRRTMVALTNLLAETAEILQTGATGVFIPTDENPISTGELVQELARAMGKKVLLLPVPQLLVRLFARVKPAFAVRLFGSLQFRSAQAPQHKRIPFSEAVAEMVKAKQEPFP
jgi:UDP-glucose 4-epimerase